MWKNKQITTSYSASIHIFIDLIDIVDNNEIKDILATTELNMEEKIQLLNKSVVNVVDKIERQKTFELKNWAEHHNMKIKLSFAFDELTEIDWKEIILDLGI